MLKFTSRCGQCLLLVVLLVGSVFLAGCSNSQLVNLDSAVTIHDLHVALQGVTVEDLDAATARAVAANDKIGAMCYPVLKVYVQQGILGLDKTAGVFDLSEKVRLQAQKINQSLIPDDLRIACAPLYQDDRAMIMRLMAITAAVAPK